MRTIGMLGGQSWETTAFYYRVINSAVRRQLGGQTTANFILHSLNLADIDSQQVAAMLTKNALDLELSGAGFVMLGTDSLHYIAGQIERELRIPFLHLADPTAIALLQAGIQRVALLSSSLGLNAIERTSYQQRLNEYGIQLDLPSEEQKETLYQLQQQQWRYGKPTPESATRLLTIANTMAAQGAQAIIIGCTALDQQLNADNSPLPIFNTNLLHAEAGAALAIS
ncbi:amino acid racemase [Neisseriaceae bacterium TC5R-5]|nr:amino acid racemase [Neisseriaceae bacterium TC5R-5]